MEHLHIFGYPHQHFLFLKDPHSHNFYEDVHAKNYRDIGQLLSDTQKKVSTINSLLMDVLNTNSENDNDHAYISIMTSSFAIKNVN